MSKRNHKQNPREVSTYNITTILSNCSRLANVTPYCVPHALIALTLDRVNAFAYASYQNTYLLSDDDTS